MRELVTIVPASDLGPWSGYVTDYAGQQMTIEGTADGSSTTTVKVTLAYPADMFAKPIKAELLRATLVKVYSSALTS